MCDVRRNRKHARMSDLVITLLEPVWVPYKTEDTARHGRQDKHGPNGEPPGSGRWKLRFPNGELYNGPSLSPSAIGTAAGCPHKWALGRLDGLKEPKKRSLELGTARHDELEKWLVHGDAPTTKGMELIQAHFPAPGDCECEGYFGFSVQRPGGPLVVFAGFFDARRPGIIHDLKTTSDMDWRKKPAQLRADLQACIYGIAEMRRQNSGQCLLKWTFALLNAAGHVTRVETVCEQHDADIDRNGKNKESTVYGEKARDLTTGVLLTWDQAVVTIAQYMPVAEFMLEAIAKKKNAKDLEKNSDFCGEYGGCQWKKIENADLWGGKIACEPPVGAGFLASMKQNKIKEKIKNGEVVTLGVSRNTEVALSQTTERKMGIGSRFAKKDGTATPAAEAPKVAPKVEEKPAAAKEPEAPPKHEQKAASNGNASGAEAASAGAGATTGAKVGTALKDRLKGVVASGKADAVAAAVDAAPANKVGQGAGAVGINPPDAQAEWTDAQQAEEEAKILAKDAPKEPAAEPKKRGRPAGSTNGAVVPAAAYATIGDAAKDLDAMVIRLLGGGYRAEATQIMGIATAWESRQT